MVKNTKNIKSIVNTSFDYTIEYVNTNTNDKSNDNINLSLNISQIASRISNRNDMYYYNYDTINDIQLKLVNVDSYCVYNLNSSEIFVNQGLLLKTINTIITEKNYNIYYIDDIIKNQIKNILLSKYNIVWSEMEDINDYIIIIKNLFRIKNAMYQRDNDYYANWYD